MLRHHRHAAFVTAGNKPDIGVPCAERVENAHEAFARHVKNQFDIIDLQRIREDLAAGSFGHRLASRYADSDIG
jgi:hypothetical protein